MVVCPTCKLPTRVGHRTEEIKDKHRPDPRLQARGLRPGDRPLMAATETYVPRLKQRYERELRHELKEQLGLSSIMQVPKISKITLNMGVGEAKTDAKVLDAAIEELTIDRRAARPGPPRPQVDRAVQAPRGDAGRRARDPARRPHVGVPRPAGLDRAAAHPRLPRAQPGVVRRPRQLLARRPRADHLPRDRLRRRQHDPRPRRRDHDHRRRPTSRQCALLRGLGLPFASEARRD